MGWDLMESTIEFIGIVATFLVTIATVLARWGQTNRKLKWWERAARVADLTQIVDSTRRLDD